MSKTSADLSISQRCNSSPSRDGEVETSPSSEESKSEKDYSFLQEASVSLKHSRIHYETLVWVLFGTFTILAILDRFFWNVWPRQTYRIGKGSAGNDKTDGLKPGPWSVKLYDILARSSGRYTICSLNLLLFTTMNSLMYWTAESWIAKRIVDMSDYVQGNRRLHKWNGILISVMTMLHVWTILAPPVFHGWKARVVLGHFEWILSERGPTGFKDADPKTRTVMLQGDDVFRLVEMTLLLAVLLPLSVKWFTTRWHLGIHVHNLISLMYFIDIVRRHTHPHSWILNTPFFLAWLADFAIGCFWRRQKSEVKRIILSDDYMLLFWKNDQKSTTVGPKHYLRLKESSILERAHVFTAFENRCNLDMANGHEWTAGLIVRVYHSRRRPQLGKKDKYSHTQRMQESFSPELYTWGPFAGEMSERVKKSLFELKPTVLVAGGSAANYIIDSIQMIHGKNHAPLTVLYTTRDINLFQWIAKWLHELLSDTSHRSLNVILTLTSGEQELTASNSETVQKLMESVSSSSSSELSSDSVANESCGKILELRTGRLNFESLINKESIIFFQGSAGLQKAVRHACKKSKSKLVSGPSYDVDSSRKGGLLEALRMNCFHVQRSVL